MTFPIVAQNRRATASWMLATAVGIGLVYGLLEGVESLLLASHAGSLSWKNGSSPKIFLYAPLVYALAYLIIGVLCVGLSMIIRRWRWDVIMVWLLIALSAYLAAMEMGQWFSELASVMLGLGIGTTFTRLYLRHRDQLVGRIPRILWIPALLAILAIPATLFAVSQQEARLIRQLPAAAPGAPNVLLLVIDTQRGDHLSPYGYDRPTSPRLARLAEEGTLFTWAFSPAPTTLPSHSSMMTGRRVMDHRAGMGGTRFLGVKYPTVAEELRKKGYATGGFVGNIYWTGRHTGLNRGFIHYDDFFGTPLDGLSRTVLGRAFTYEILPKFGMVDIPGRKDAELVNQELLDWLPGKDQPFFAFVNYFDVHAPYFPPAEFAGKVSPLVTTRRPSKIEIGAWNEHGRLPDDSTLSAWRDRYDESIMYLDHQIGVLLDSLDARGVLENTLVIVTADHGEGFGEHGMVHHGGSLYTDQVRVPLILRQPGKVPSGARLDTPVDLRSLPSTIMEAATGDAGRFPAPSLLHVPDSGEVAIALSEGPKVPGNPRDWPTGRADVQSLMMGHFQLITMKNGERELYNLAIDPNEMHNLVNDVSMRDTLNFMMTKLTESFAPARTRPTRTGSR